MADYLFKDYSDDVKRKIRELGVSWLDEASGEIEAQTKQNTRVDTGQTKASWKHIVREDELKAQVGSRYENTVWEEFGTGIHALDGNGRKDVPWVYQDANGKWHKTKGKKPSRAFHHAYTSLKNVVIRSAQDMFRRGMK